MFIKKAKKVVGAMMLGVMLFGVTGALQANANNWQDTSFTFSFSNGQKYTAVRAKQDTSKLYMKVNSITSGTSYTAHAVGCASTSTSTYVDCSRGYSYKFSSAGQSYYMTSWVYENGYRYARIAGSPNYAYAFSASGVWSPDNLNGY